jgi:hypothetical protein
MGLVIGEKDMDILQLQIENVHQCMKWAWLLMIIDLPSIENYRFKTYGLRFGRLFRKFTKTIMNDKTIARNYSNSEYNSKKSQPI